MALIMACDAEDSSGVEDQTSTVITDDLSYSDDALVFDFGVDGEADWYAVNDTVMGGVSNGALSFEDETMVFEGNVSTDSNGGFASIRSPQDEMDLSMYQRVLIRIKSEGLPFSMILADSPLWFDDQYKYNIVVPDNEWNIIEIPFEAFEVYELYSGYPESTGETMDSEDAEELLHMELMSEQFVDGEFKIEVDYIAFD
ncbi:MAG: CIA30 family protein [Myxococcota bacterium]|nr:CIA30 family protein [Myxococcota bacterium]